MQLTIHPLTPDRWPACEDLFSAGGPVSRCWCMYWRIGSAYRQRASQANQADFHALVESGPPPGLLAYAGDLAVGWCQLTPRADLAWLDQNWRLRQVDDAPVWSISCFYVRKGFRKQGVTAALIAAALRVARQAGAPALEAYPLDADLTPSASGTGFTTTFERAGFKVVARQGTPRPIMRYDFREEAGAAPIGRPDSGI